MESIIGQRVKNGRTQYLLRWKFFDDDEDTWEYEDDMNCPELIDEYKARQESLKDIQPSSHNEKVIDTVYDMKPKMIIGAFKKAGKLIYRVECANNKYICVESSILREIDAEMICTFLENKITLKQ